MPAAAKKAHLAFDESSDESEELERLRQKLARRPKSPSISSSSSDGDSFSADDDDDDDDDVGGNDIKEPRTSKHWAGTEIVVKQPPTRDKCSNADTIGTTKGIQPKENDNTSNAAGAATVAASLDAASSSSSSSSSSCDSSLDDLSLEGNDAKVNGLAKSSAPSVRPTAAAKHLDAAVPFATARHAVPQPPTHAVAASFSNKINTPTAGNSHTQTTNDLSAAAPLEDCDGYDEFPDFDEAALAALEVQLQNESSDAVAESAKNDFDDDNFPDLGEAELEALDQVVAHHAKNAAPSESARSTPVMSNRSPVRNPYQTSRDEVASPAVQDSSTNNNSASPIVDDTSAPPIVNGVHHHNHTCSYGEGDASGDEWHYETIDGTEKENIANNPTSYSLPFDEEKLDAFGFEMEETDGQLDGASAVNRANSNKEPIGRQAVPPTHLEERASERFQGDQHRSATASEPKGTDVEFDDVFDFGAPSPSIERDDDVQPTQESPEDAVKSEIHPSLYAPEPRDAIEDPIVHKFSPRNRPVHARLSIPVAEVFDAPANTLFSFESFNQLQSELSGFVGYSDDNVVVSAPTGAGKTAVFEMAMARFFQVDCLYQNASTISKRRKIVYVSPSKALCEERFFDWSKRLEAMNLSIQVAVITGDQDPSEAFGEFSSAHFILTTPEKMDSLTRKWTEHFFLFASVKLFMVDEVHMIADESRGCCLEAIVLRMKTIQRAASRLQVTQEELGASSYANTTPDVINSPLRFVAVSATLPNISDIACFFQANEAHIFDESYRPVPLTTHVIGQGRIRDNSSSSHFHFWKNLDRNVPEIIMRFSEGRPSIVFCHTKAGTESLANLLAAAHTIGRRDANTPVLASQTMISKLQRVLMYGIAYHHAGLEMEDRRLVEKAFREGKIRVVCATSTLAMGVNLPAHLVVVNGTSAWRGGEHGYQDLDQASLLQMIGRAGRPGFDTSGTAVIMTDTDSKKKFQALATSGLRPAISQCRGERLVETINTAVSQRVITNSETAIRWFQGTLSFIQAVRNPKASGISVVSAHSIDTHCLQLCRGAIQQLQEIGALHLGAGQEIFPLPASHVMSRHLVEFRAMQQITQIPFDATTHQVLKTLGHIDGLQRPVRRSEKKALNAAHKLLKLYKLDGPPSKVRVKEPWEKSFVLIQVYIEQVEMQCDYALRQEMACMVQYASRVLSAIEEYSSEGSKHYNVLLRALLIKRALAVHLWNGNDGLLRQIKGISQQLCFSLHMAGISTFDDVLKSSEATIEKAANRSPPFGADLQKACSKILSARLTVTATLECATTGGTPSSLICNLERPQSEEVASTMDHSNGQGAAVTYSLLVYTDRPNGGLYLKENIVGPETFRVIVPPRFGKITLKLVASIVGLDDSFTVDGNDEITPSSLFATQSAGDSKSPSARIRNANKKKRDTVKRQLTQAGANVQDPRIRQQQKQKGPERFRQTRLQLAPSHQASVTPSPKPPPTTDATARGQEKLAATATVKARPSAFPTKRNDSASTPAAAVTQDTATLQAKKPIFERDGAWGPQTSRTRSNTAAPAVTQDPTALQAAQPVFESEAAWKQHATRATFSAPESAGKHDPIALRGTQPVFENEAAAARTSFSTAMRRSVQPAASQSRTAVAPPAIDFDASSARGNPLKRAANQSPHGSDSRFSTWKRAKQHHQKQQQRAFHKGLNPFSDFQHDPNDSEAHLSSLSSIIPPAALAENLYASAARTIPQRTLHQGRPRGYPSCSMSTQQLLEQKAEELANMHCDFQIEDSRVQTHQSPPWGASSQDWCLQSEEMRQPWGTGNRSLESQCAEQLYQSDGWNSVDPYTDFSGYEEFRNDEIHRPDPVDHGNYSSQEGSFAGWTNASASPEIFRDEPSGTSFPPSQQNSWNNQNGLGGHDGDESFESAYFY